LIAAQDPLCKIQGLLTGSFVPLIGITVEYGVVIGQSNVCSIRRNVLPQQRFVDAGPDRLLGPARRAIPVEVGLEQDLGDGLALGAQAREVRRLVLAPLAKDELSLIVYEARLLELAARDLQRERGHVLAAEEPRDIGGRKEEATVSELHRVSIRQPAERSYAGCLSDFGGDPSLKTRRPTLRPSRQACLVAMNEPEERRLRFPQESEVESAIFRLREEIEEKRQPLGALEERAVSLRSLHGLVEPPVETVTPLPTT